MANKADQLDRADVSDLKLSKEERIFIIKDSLKAVTNTIYKCVIDNRVGKRAEDQNMQDAAKAMMKKMETAKIEYEREIALIEKE
jgi:hypothetical protein